jgi:hypothetical protein
MKCKCAVAGDGGNKSARIAQNKAEIDFLKGIGSYTAKTDPALNAISVSDVDNFIGCAITLTGAGNSQTLPTPTVTSRYHFFTVVNDSVLDFDISINDVILESKESTKFIWITASSVWVNEDDSGIWFNDGTNVKTQDSILNINTQSGALIGGDGAGDDLNLKSTIHATKGKILFGNSVYDEVNNRLGVRVNNPAAALHVDSDSLGEALRLESAAAQTYITFKNLEVTGNDFIGYIGTTPTNSVAGYDAMTLVAYGNRDLSFLANALEFMKFEASTGNILLKPGGVEKFRVEASGNILASLGLLKIGVSEQSENAYILQTKGIWWTDDGLSTGNLRGSLEIGSGDILTHESSTGIRFTSSNAQFRIRNTHASTAFVVDGGATFNDNIVSSTGDITALAGNVVSAGLVTNGKQVIKRTASAVDYNPSALTSDYLIAITDTSIARAVTISTEDINSGSIANPRIFVIKDESGNAGVNNITVSGESGNIDGAANVAISANYGSLTVYADGTNLFTY